MRKSMMFVVLLFILLPAATSRELTEEQENIPKIQTAVCPVGQTRCLVKAWQQCDGTTFVTKKLCNLQEVCDTEKGCVPRAEKIVPTQRGVSKAFYYFRYKECRAGQIQCNKRFIRQCINNRWVDNTCSEGEWCNPTKGCIQKTGLTRLKQRELSIPREPKIPLLQRH